MLESATLLCCTWSLTILPKILALFKCSDTWFFFLSSLFTTSIAVVASQILSHYNPTPVQIAEETFLPLLIVSVLGAMFVWIRPSRGTSLVVADSGIAFPDSPLLTCARLKCSACRYPDRHTVLRCCPHRNNAQRDRSYLLRESGNVGLAIDSSRKLDAVL